MIYETEEQVTNLLSDIPRLPIRENQITVDDVRVIKLREGHLIFFDDYERILEQGGPLLAQVIHKYGIDPDKLGLIVDEVRLIRKPHLCKIAKNACPSGKLFIRRINTARTTKLAEEALEYFYENGDSSKFDAFVEGTLGDGMAKIGKAFGQGVGRAAAQQGKQFKKDAISTAKKGALGLAVLGTASYLAGKKASQMVDDDARKHPAYRSQLIAKLRTLRGLLPKYEGKYARADRLSYEQKGILGKMIHKIKAAIKAITFRLRHMMTGDVYYWKK